MDRTGRRRFLQGSLALAGVGLLAGCTVESPPAEPPKRVPRIGILSSQEGPPDSSPNFQAFREGLRDLGYVEGQNVSLEYRWGEGSRERLRERAAELAVLPVDVFVTSGPPSISAAKEATSTIPIVMPLADDPVRLGYVASLARPGGNITGLNTLITGISGKRLDLLKAAFPAITRVAVLWHLDDPSHAPQLAELEATARALVVELRSLPMREPGDVGPVFQAATRERVDALTAAPGGFMNSVRPQIVEFAAQNRLPAIYAVGAWAEAGGLMAYGANVPDLFRRAATYVDRILKGASPADLPVEQPTKFDFVLNLKTARALGLTIPQSVLQQATEIIQ